MPPYVLLSNNFGMTWIRVDVSDDFGDDFGGDFGGDFGDDTITLL